MSVAKTFAHVAARMHALPHWISYRAAETLLGEQRAFVMASERIGKIPGHAGIYARQAFYRRVLRAVGEDVYFGYMSLFSKAQATIGDRVYIGRFCCIGWAQIGEDVLLGDGVQILSGGRQHGSSAMFGGTLRDNPQQYELVTIGRGAWLGAGAIVMADVGPGAIVGAGSVVTSPVEDGAKVAGAPARHLEPSNKIRAYT